MKYRFAAIIISILIIFIHSNSASATDDLQTLDHLSDEALQLVKAERYDDAISLLHTFDRKLSQFVAEKILINMDELRIIHVSLEEVLKALEYEANKEDVIRRMTKFRLVVDAVSSNYQPLWTEMEGTVMSAFQGLKNAVDKGNQEEYSEQLHSFLSVYDVIYPSLLLDVSPEAIHKIEARVHYIQQNKDILLTAEESKVELDALGNDLQSVFDQISEDEADPSIWWVIISTGGIIISTLSYVGWKKYKADREKSKTKKGFYN